MLGVGHREVVLGVLAVQLDFAPRAALVETAQAWLRDRNKSLGDLLVERGVVTAYQRRLLDPLVDEHLSSHGNDSSVIVESLHASGIVQEAFETRQAERSLEETCEVSDVVATADPGQPGTLDATEAFPMARSGDDTTGTRSGQRAGDRYVVGRLHAPPARRRSVCR